VAGHGTTWSSTPSRIPTDRTGTDAVLGHHPDPAASQPSLVMQQASGATEHYPPVDQHGETHGLGNHRSTAGNCASLTRKRSHSSVGSSDHLSLPIERVKAGV
jgi:hypothetical protein